MKTLHILQHVAYEGPGKVAEWAASREISLQTHFVPDGLAPAILGAEGLVVLGGPMGVHDTDEFPWLAPELEMIGQFIKTGKPVLGICLGAQLIAAASGARVYPNNEKELGWGEVRRAPEAASHPLLRDWPEAIHVFHWHGETFDLPEGATLLGGSEVCPHQGFVRGNCLALQFHLELGLEELKTLAQSNRLPEWQGPHVAGTGKILSEAEALTPSARNLLFETLDRWVESGIEEN